MRRTSVAAVLGALALATAVAWATTWADVEYACPICKAKVRAQEPASFGSYIYGWPSRMQLLFWPLTDRASLQRCGACGYAAFLGDFEKPPADKVAAIRDGLKSLSTRKAASPEAGAGSSIAAGFDAAEITYAALGKGDDFWSLFYRAKGYHLSEAGDADGARAARREALARIGKGLAGSPPPGDRKELLLAKAAMLYLVGDAKEALAILKEAEAVRIEATAEVTAEQAANAQQYLDEVIGELRGYVEKGAPVPQ
jgi:tetratricopeptide (TPR) repeat protein